MPDFKTGGNPYSPTNFASMLAAFGGVAKEAPWDSSPLADCVSAINCERSLHKHHPLGNDQANLTAVPSDGRNDRKTSSISIRLTACEERQLRIRAAEAQLSLSDYLRSCLFEAQSLRSQAREAPSEMRSAAAQAPHPSDEKRPVDSLEHGFRVFPFCKRRQQPDS